MRPLKRITLVTYIFYLLTFSIISFVIVKKLFFPNKTDQTENIKKEEQVAKINEFGFISDSLSREDATINPNETFSDLLLNYNVPYSKIDFISRNFKDTFDFRKIVAGKTYHVYTTKDSLGKIAYLVYEKNPIDYVVVNLKDTTDVIAGSKKVTVQTKTAEGVIHSSLYQTMVDNEIDPELVYKLAEIYAWQIDFYRIQKGDSFKVVYEEQYVDGRPIGIGKVIGAYFNASGEAFYAINFQKNGDDHFYDENGQSLRKAFLKAPVKFTRISSRYTLRRYHPIEHRVKAHLGTDYVAPTGTPIHSTGDGIVTEARYKRFNGNYVKIRHNSVYSTQYLHMSKIARGIHPGVHVKQGQVIGYVGMTGEATGPHVCYRFWKNGAQVDPFKQKIPSAHPVAKMYLNDFSLVKENVLAELDSAASKSQTIKMATTRSPEKP
jgi:murein DD-endopeptidase MepM/ murein hydrolase activator NlpD